MSFTLPIIILLGTMILLSLIRSINPVRKRNEKKTHFYGKTRIFSGVVGFLISGSIINIIFFMFIIEGIYTVGTPIRK